MRVDQEFSPILGDYRPPGQRRTRVDESSSRDKTNAGQTRENSPRLSKNKLSRLDKSVRETPRVYESLSPNEIESFNSHQFSAILALIWLRL